MIAAFIIVQSSEDKTIQFSKGYPKDHPTEPAAHSVTIVQRKADVFFAVLDDQGMIRITDSSLEIEESDIRYVMHLWIRKLDYMVQPMQDVASQSGTNLVAAPYEFDLALAVPEGSDQILDDFTINRVQHEIKAELERRKAMPPTTRNPAGYA